MSQVPLAHFDRGKLFYPLVMNYVLQLLGIKEISLRGLPGVSRDFRISPDALGAGESEASLRASIEKLAGPLELQCEATGQHITVDPELIGKESVTNPTYIFSFLMPAAGSLLILAHELSKHEGFHDSGPLWEFLRHCRNAAGHNGRFTFSSSEPRRPAAWRRLTIDRGLEGTPLFKNGAGSGFLSPGDPILLLWDIEQAYPILVHRPNTPPYRIR